jgi:hypothetical protein
VDGRHHRVQVRGSVLRTIEWYVDDELVATKKSSDDNVAVESDRLDALAVGLKFTALGRAKRVTLYASEGDVPASARALLGTGGLDLDPEPGSPAARREQRIREHPWRHATLATAGGVAKVVVPILLGLLVVRFAVDLPWPDWRIPWPDIDLPRIPGPEIPWPEIPWPDIDLPDWELPAWVGWLLDKLKYLWPVLLAAVLAKSEIDRRRKQDALKAGLEDEVKDEVKDGLEDEASPKHRRPHDRARRADTEGKAADEDGPTAG